MSTSSAASKPAIPGRLVATTYRQLLRLALRFDLDPAFRSLVCVSHASVYSGELQCWRGIPRSKDASPIEQYLEDVLRFANLASDFYIPDPENSVTRKVDWTVVKQLYPDQQFSASSSPEETNENNVEGDLSESDHNNSKNKFNNYPLAYLARLHFRGGMELNQFKKEMHKVLEEAYMREIKDYNTNSSNEHQEKLGSSSSSAAAAASSSSTATSKLGAIANAQPSAAQLGNAFHCVRWLRNLTQVVNTDHPLQGRVTAQDLFPDESVLGLEDGKNDPVKRRELLGELELIPCYRSELRRRWKNQTGASATSEAIFSTRKQQEDAAAAVRKAASFKPSDATQTTETIQQQQEKKKEEEELSEQQSSSSSSEKETSKSAPKMDKAKVLQKLKERQAAKRLREEKENEEAASKPEERWSPLFSFYEKKGASTTSTSSTTSAPSPSSDINEEEAKRSNLIHIDKGGAKWVDVPQKVTGNSASAFFLCAHPAMPGFFNGNVLLMHQLDPENGALGFTINRPLRNNDNVAVPVWAVFSQDTVNAGNSGDASAASTSASNSILHHLEDNRIFVGGPVSIAPPPVARGPGSLSYGAGLVGGKGRGSFNHPHHSHPHGGSQREQSFLRVAHFLHRIPNVPYSRLVAPGVWWGGDEQVIAAKLASKEASPRDVMVMVGFAGWGSGQLEGEICSGSWITAVSKSPRDDKTYERLLSEMESTRPFASPSSSGTTSTEAEKKSDKKKKSSDESNNNDNKNDNNNNETHQKKDDTSSSSSSATKSKLPSKFDTVADYIFSGNVPVSREERLFDYQKEPDPMPYQWREFIRRLGAPAMARLAVLEPEGNWMNSSSSSSKEGDNRK